MVVIGIDDTDSREGMCTTYLAALVAERIRETGGDVERLLLVRLNPAVEHKTRGNAAVAVDADCDAGTALAVARDLVERHHEPDANTNPGVVVADHAPDAAQEAVVDFAREAVRDHHAIDDAVDLIESAGYRSAGWGNGRGRIGALAAVGAGAWLSPPGASDADAPRGALGDRTFEFISYRYPERRGTHRDLDYDALFAAADEHYPATWDTVDRGSGDAVCVPRTPGPILHGIRGDDPEAVRAVAEAIPGEPVERTALFLTNQGTDAHLRDADLAAVREGRAYRVTGSVTARPETREGGHVFFELAEVGTSLRCAAFEPTKRFRDRVRALRVGDRLTVCGEVKRGTLKLEKFAVRDLVRTERVTPTCPDCGRTMESAGTDQGYRCRDCGTAAPGKIERELERDLAVGWYEVPPSARRHVAKPLIRGGFDAPVHAEQ